MRSSGGSSGGALLGAAAADGRVRQAPFAPGNSVDGSYPPGLSQNPIS